MISSGHKPRNVRHVDHQHSPRCIGDLAASLEIEYAGIGAGPYHKHLRPFFHRLLLKSVVVYPLGLAVHRIGGS